MSEIKTAICEICGLPMPEGEKMFKFHGHSGPCPKPAMLDTAYAAAAKALRGTSSDIGAGELERVVMAVLASIAVTHEPIAWRVKHGGGFTTWFREANAIANANATNGTVEPLYASPAVEWLSRLEIAKAFHDGPLGADDHEFRADSEQGKWCLEVVDFFERVMSAKAEGRAPDLT